jgi:hypothetical protein
VRRDEGCPGGSAAALADGGPAFGVVLEEDALDEGLEDLALLVVELGGGLELKA